MALNLRQRDCRERRSLAHAALRDLGTDCQKGRRPCCCRCGKEKTEDAVSYPRSLADSMQVLIMLRKNSAPFAHVRVAPLVAVISRHVGGAESVSNPLGRSLVVCQSRAPSLSGEYKWHSATASRTLSTIPKLPSLEGLPVVNPTAGKNPGNCSINNCLVTLPCSDREAL